MPISPRILSRISRQARIVAADMREESNPTQLNRMAAAMSVLTIAALSDEDNQANQLIDAARKLRTKKT